MNIYRKRVVQPRSQEEIEQEQEHLVANTSWSDICGGLSLIGAVAVVALVIAGFIPV